MTEPVTRTTTPAAAATGPEKAMPCPEEQEPEEPDGESPVEQHEAGIYCGSTRRFLYRTTGTPVPGRL